MKFQRLLFFVLVVCFVWTSSFGQLPANCGSAVNRMVVAGDSWAQYMFDDGSYNTFLKAYGHADKVAISQTYESEILCAPSPGATDYAVSGSEARQWADEVNYNYLQNLINALSANPSIDLVILSIGGNDILAGKSDGGWYKDMDLDVPNSEQDLFDEIEANTQYIMDEVWSRARPDINFVISGYDYPNFNVTALWCGFYACDKREDLSRDPVSDLITDAELNAMMLGVEEIRQDMADANSKIFYDNSMGIAHHYFGFGSTTSGSTPEPEGVTPYTEGGDPGFPTDRANFRLVGICGLGGFLPADPIHLDAVTYEYKIKNMYDHIAFEEFRGTPNSTFYSEAGNDGYVDRIGGGVSSAGIRVGDEGPFCCSGGADNDYFGILSFDTGSLPDDAMVTGASIYMIKSGEDDNPFKKGDRNAVLDIKSGHFGSAASLEASDATDIADETDIGCFHGEGDANKDAIRIDIDPSALQYVNKTGKTQVRFSFDVSDWSNEYINFYDGGGNAAFAPPTEAEARFASNNFSTRTIVKSTDENGEDIEEIVTFGEPIEKKEGYMYYEKLISSTENEDGTTTEVYKMIAAIEHPGLAKHMSDAFNAPGGGLAPFMDVAFTSALPVEIVRFDVRRIGLSAELNWETESEINNSGFDIEHSIDGISWNRLGSIDSKGGHDLTSYSFIHSRLIYGINYYRLKIIDLDGSYDYSKIRELKVIGDKGGQSAYPNPFNDRITIGLLLDVDRRVDVRITDFLGKSIFKYSYSGKRGQFMQTISDLDHLQAGTYILEIVADQVYTSKIIKE